MPFWDLWVNTDEAKGGVSAWNEVLGVNWLVVTEEAKVIGRNTMICKVENGDGENWTVAELMHRTCSCKLWSDVTILL